MGRKIAERPKGRASSRRNPRPLLVLQAWTVQGKTCGKLVPRNRLPEYMEASEVEALIRCAPNGAAALLMLIQWRAGLRHSAARHWLASGIPINVVSRWLGHASLQTTLIYLEVLPDPLGDIERVP